MRKYRTAFQAAKAYAKKYDETEEFEEGYNGYTDKLFDNNKIQQTQDKSIGGVKWIIRDGSGWYIFDLKGKVVNGPFEQKKRALQSINEDSSTYIDTGIYKTKETGFYVARKRVFESHPDLP